MRISFRCLLVLGVACSFACESSEEDSDGGGASSDAQPRGDASKPIEAGARLDASGGDDAGDVDDAGGAADDDAGAESPNTVLDLHDVKSNPSAYTWFDFRPNVKKLILSGAAETEHMAILWYTTMDGGVGLHYHSKTESVFVIDGTQTDGKGVYPTGSLYFNPPGSGHQITNSTGFFLLAYAAPPDFMRTAEIGEYTPIRIDTKAPEWTESYAFEEKKPGVEVYAVPLEDMGGMSAAFIETMSTDAYDYTGNYLLVLDGRCAIEGQVYGPGVLVVAKDVAPRAYALAATSGGSCLALGVSF